MFEQVTEFIGTALGKVFGSQNERTLKRLQPIVQQINALEPRIAALTDDQLRAKKDEFQARLAALSGDPQA